MKNRNRRKKERKGANFKTSKSEFLSASYYSSSQYEDSENGESPKGNLQVKQRLQFEDTEDNNNNNFLKSKRLGNLLEDLKGQKLKERNKGVNEGLLQSKQL